MSLYVKMDIMKPRLPYLEYAIVRYCNLNCKDKFQHCINIHTTDLTGWKINKILDSAFNLCSYCAFMDWNAKNDEKFYPWKCVEKDDAQLSEWIINS